MPLQKADSNGLSSDDRLSAQAHLLSTQLLSLRERLFPPKIAKNATQIYFSKGEAAD